MSAAPYDDSYPGGVTSGRPFHRYTARNRCPHCEHETPCIYFDNGDVLCHREGDAHRWTDSFIGGYWHRAIDADNRRPTPPRTPAASAVAITPADRVMVDAIYTDFIALCPLSEDQRIAHDLTQAQASRYGWLPRDPDSQAHIIAALLTTHTREELLGVPGFREHHGRLTIRGAGLMLPTRDLDGKIQAIDLRRAVVEEGQSRYIKLSSRIDGDLDAPSPGAPPHVAMPVDGVVVPGILGITEGVKKADYAADALGYPVVSIPGISATRVASGVLERFAGDVVVIMLDQDDPKKNDGRTVANVERARSNLATAATSLGYAVRLAMWDHAPAKGIDDLLAAGGHFTLERYAPAVAGPTSTPHSERVILDAPVFVQLLREANAARTLREKYNHFGAVARDPRLQAGQKQTLTALLDVCGAPTSQQPWTEPRKVPRAAIADRTGQAASTISINVPDLADMGIIKLDRRTVERTRDRACKDGVVRSVTLDEEEWWISTGPIPNSRLSKKDLQALASRKQTEAKRKACPGCGSTKLEAALLRCQACGQTCTHAQAETAGARITIQDDGLHVDTLTGEIFHPGQPCPSFTPADVSVSDSETLTDTHSPNDDNETINAEAPSATASVKTSVSESETLTTAPETWNDATYRESVPVFTSTYQGDRFPKPTSDAVKKPCPGGCGTQTPNGWWCLPCRDRPVGILHIPNDSATGQEVRHDR